MLKVGNTTDHTLSSVRYCSVQKVIVNSSRRGKSDVSKPRAGFSLALLRVLQAVHIRRALPPSKACQELSGCPAGVQALESSAQAGS